MMMISELLWTGFINNNALLTHVKVTRSRSKADVDSERRKGERITSENWVEGCSNGSLFLFPLTKRNITCSSSCAGLVRF